MSSIIKFIDSFLKQADGSRSSKKIIGSLLILSSIALSIFVVIFSTLVYQAVVEGVSSIIITLISAGSGLLGISVFKKGVKPAVAIPPKI